MTVETTALSPREQIHIVGHDEAASLFYESFRSERLHHAWLISGPQGIGKATLAFALARLLLGGETPGTATFQRISAGTHGDLMVLEREIDPKTKKRRSAIIVDDVRRIYHFLHHTAVEGGWRVVIIDGAEFMNPAAANALLKMLEEPPPKAVLIMTSAAPEKLLPTLRSRCRRLPLKPLSLTEMQALFPNMSQEQLIHAHGAPGRVLFFSADQDGKIAALVHAAITGQTLEIRRWEEISRMARSDDIFSLFCELLNDALAEKARELTKTGAIAEAAKLAGKTAELALLRQQTERFSLDKAQAMRQAFILGGGSGTSPAS